MKLAVVALLLGLSACRIEAPSPDAPPGISAPETSDGDGFFARDDHGNRRPLTLRQLSAHVTSAPATVRTRLALEIAGPADMRVEAEMRLPIPRGAAVTGATLWVDGRPMKAAFAERERARQIYQSIVSRRRDPALVTWAGPGAVQVSIFPVEPGKTRRFELDWVEPAASAIRVPVVRAGARIVGRAVMEIDGREVAAGAGELVPLAPVRNDAKLWTARAPGDPFQRILVRGAGPVGPPRVVVVTETSAAMSALERAEAHAALETILRALPADARVTILAADWSTSAVAEGVDPGEAARALGQLDAVISAGALHLARALTDATARARRDDGAVVFIGRGHDPFPGDALRVPLQALRDAGLRLSVVSVGPPPGPLADAAAISGGVAVETGTLGRTMRELLAAVAPRPRRPALVARGLDDWRPLDTADGGTVWIGRALEAPPLGKQEAPAAKADPADLLALWDRARLSWAERTNQTIAARTDRAALAPLRALLVLENDAEYARWGLPVPSALASEDFEPKSAMRQTPHAKEGLFGRDSALGNDAADVLGGLVGNQIGEAYGVGALGVVGVGAGGGGPAEGTIGVGNLGTIGKGGGGGNGSGYGRGAGGLGGRRAHVPDVVPGLAIVRGSLDKEIIRRIIRRHINEVKYCYEQELTKKPDLGGRIMVQFTIAASGQVIQSVLQNSTMGDARVENCTVQAIRRWEFPKPLGGGIVIVSYPFVFTPAGTAPAEWTAPPVTAPAAEPALTPASEEALVILDGREPIADRVARVCERLGLDRTSDPESAAWSIDRTEADLGTATLVARLLAAAGRSSDAVRVLSEHAPFAARSVAAEMRRLDAPHDAEEVLALQKRVP